MATPAYSYDINSKAFYTYRLDTSFADRLKTSFAKDLRKVGIKFQHSPL